MNDWLAIVIAVSVAFAAGSCIRAVYLHRQIEAQKPGFNQLMRDARRARWRD